jgi:4-diphosphocytidyl-2-C-methyl-D-erythritol kinase
MICFPNAKINLGLRVVSKRPDGYHNITSFLYPIPLYDVLEFLPAECYSLDVYGHQFSENETSNLVTNAWSLCHKAYGIPPVAVKLLKRIPPGSGLGGGSADAAFMLRALNDYFHLELNEKALMNYAAEIGSDCIFFVSNRPAMVLGRGEQVTPVSDRLKDNWLLLVFPGFPVDTAQAYESITAGHYGEDVSRIYSGQINQWKENLVNDFESFVFQKHPELNELKNVLYAAGAFYASLTGSGSAVYGLFHKKPPAIKLQRNYSAYLMKF